MHKHKYIIIGIDGPCASGKTTLAYQLAQVFECNVFHMDDFFLPSSMRTEDRLAQPGGNVHHERFKKEVVMPLLNGLSFSYRPFRCDIEGFENPIYVGKKKINIVEGVYSLHPNLQYAYCYKIFLTVNPQVQYQRILMRDGREKLKEFLNKWIPMENKYFSVFKIRSVCDLVMDTSHQK